MPYYSTQKGESELELVEFVGSNGVNCLKLENLKVKSSRCGAALHIVPPTYMA